MPPDTPSPLSDIALQVAECYAVIYPEAPSRTKVQKWLNTARKAVEGERSLSNDEMRDAVSELVEAGVLLPSRQGGAHGPARGPMARPGTITRFCESAVQRGVAHRFLDQLDLADNAHHGRYYTQPSRHVQAHIRLALLTDRFADLAEQVFPEDIWFWLVEPCAKPYLARLPQSHLAAACEAGLSTLIEGLLPVDEFAGTVSQMMAGGMAATYLALARALEGRLDDAESLVAQTLATSDPEKRWRVGLEAIRAMVASLRGDDAAAEKWIRSSVELERAGTRKRIVYPTGVAFGVALPSLVRSGTTEARALYSELIASRRKLKVHDSVFLWLMLADHADKPRRDRHSVEHLYLGLEGCLYAIALCWHNSYEKYVNHPDVVTWLRTLLMDANRAGYHWLVAEMLHVLERVVSKPDLLDDKASELVAESSADERMQGMGVKTYTQLVPTVEPWEYGLRELEQLTLAKRGKKSTAVTDGAHGSKRLVWQLVNEHHGVGVVPVEQSLGKNGRWSSGRRVSLKRLSEQRDGIPHLSAQDVSACQSIRKLVGSGWYGGTTSYETDSRTLYKLAGHPLVFDSDGQPVEVVECPPLVHLTRQADGTRVQVLPTLPLTHYLAHLDPQQQRLEVTHFTAAQRRICGAIPAEGIVVPDTADDRLEAVLAVLSADIAVHGDKDTAGQEHIAGDPSIVMVLDGAGDALRVRLQVEPFAESATRFGATEGGAFVYVQTTSGPVAVQRDLTAEREQLSALLGRSEVLTRHFDGRTELTLADTLSALELLEELPELDVRCIWQGELPVKIRASAGVSQVSLDMKSAKEWFSAGGSVDTGDEQPMPLDTLLALMRANPGSRFVEMGKGEFLALSRTLKQQLETLDAFSQPARKGGGADQIHPMAMLSLEPLLAGATIKADADWKSLRKKVQHINDTEPEVPAALQADLRSYQREGFAWLARLGHVGAGACLADDMGLGKTVQTLAVLLSRAEGGPALVVAPTSVVGNWLQEVQRFAPDLNVLDYTGSVQQRADVLDGIGEFELVVISYGLLVNDSKALAAVHWHTVVLDESQAIRNASTQRAKCARALSADFRIATTGTPVQNSLMDLHSLFAFLNPSLLGGEVQFRKRFGLPITRHEDEHAREQLQQLVAPFMLRRLKRDVLTELPARTELKLDVVLSSAERALYTALRQEALDSLAESSDDASADSTDTKGGQRQVEILAHLMRLRRLCCNPALVAPEWTGPMSKLDVVSDALTELLASGHRALVFSQFVDHLKIVQNKLESLKISYQYLDGSTRSKQRTERVAAFQRGEGAVFLISLTAGGTGLNLTGADYVIHLDPWWNPAVEDQASDRAHRLGQKRPVTIVRIVTTDTIEEQIQDLHATKRELADSVLAGAGGESLDTEALLSLLRGA